MNATTSLPKLDAAVVQAVVELRRAVRAVRVLEVVAAEEMSPSARGIHERKLNTEKAKLRAARIALEQLLEDV